MTIEENLGNKLKALAYRDYHGTPAPAIVPPVAKMITLGNCALTCAMMITNAKSENNFFMIF